MGGSSSTVPSLSPAQAAAADRQAQFVLDTSRSLRPVMLSVMQGDPNAVTPFTAPALPGIRAQQGAQQEHLLRTAAPGGNLLQLLLANINAGGLEQQQVDSAARQGILTTFMQLLGGREAPIGVTTANQPGTLNYLQGAAQLGQGVTSVANAFRSPPPTMQTPTPQAGGAYPASETAAPGAVLY